MSNSQKVINFRIPKRLPERLKTQIELLEKDHETQKFEAFRPQRHQNFRPPSPVCTQIPTREKFGTRKFTFWKRIHA